MSVTYGGSAIFGRSVIVDVVPNESEAQVTAFFGVSGVYSLWGGGRGRLITVTGVLYADTFPDLALLEGILLTYDDGVGRDLYDAVRDVTYSNVVFRGGFKRTDRPSYGHGGVLQPYQAFLYGLI